MRLRNLYLGLKDQLPFSRFIRNFCITRNAWGLLNRRYFKGRKMFYHHILHTESV